MKAEKRHALQNAGWKVGSAHDFLDLGPEEREFIELKLRLAEAFRKKREGSNLTQVEAARRLHSSQSRVAKMEAGDSSVSIDLLVRSLLTLGADRRTLARVVGSGGKARAA